MDVKTFTRGVGSLQLAVLKFTTKKRDNRPSVSGEIIVKVREIMRYDRNITLETVLNAFWFLRFQEAPSTGLKRNSCNMEKCVQYGYRVCCRRTLTLASTN